MGTGKRIAVLSIKDAAGVSLTGHRFTIDLARALDGASYITGPYRMPFEFRDITGQIIEIRAELRIFPPAEEEGTRS